MDPILIAVAFVLGFAARHVGLPPLVGFLVAGFALGGAGLEGGPMLSQIADRAVIVMKVSIGPKLIVGRMMAPPR